MKIRYRIIVHMTVQKVCVKENDMYNINDVCKLKFAKVEDCIIQEGFLVVLYYDEHDKSQIKIISNKHIIDVDIEPIEDEQKKEENKITKNECQFASFDADGCYCDYFHCLVTCAGDKDRCTGGYIN